MKCRGIDLIFPHRRNRRKSHTQDGSKLRRCRGRWKVNRLASGPSASRYTTGAFGRPVSRIDTVCLLDRCVGTVLKIRSSSCALAEYFDPTGTTVLDFPIATVRNNGIYSGYDAPSSSSWTILRAIFRRIASRSPRATSILHSHSEVREISSSSGNLPMQLPNVASSVVR